MRKIVVRKALSKILMVWMHVQEWIAQLQQYVDVYVWQIHSVGEHVDKTQDERLQCE